MTDIDLNKEKLTPAEAAVYMTKLGDKTTEARLAMMRYRGNGPRFVRPTPGRVLYFRNDIDEWYAKRSYQSTREYAR